MTVEDVKDRPLFYAKQYYFIGDVIASLPTRSIRVLVARTFADKLAKDNKHFKRTMFMRACDADN